MRIDRGDAVSVPLISQALVYPDMVFHQVFPFLWRDVAHRFYDSAFKELGQGFVQQHQQAVP